jgi:hypothetical protein
MAGLELERAQLLGGQRGAGEGVVLAAGDHLPAQHRQLARGGHHGDLHAAPRAHALIERAQRSWGLDRDPGGLDEHPARVRAALPGDAAMAGGLASGLLEARVQPEIADELVRRGEALEVADGGGDRHRHGDVDAGDRHQPLGVLTSHGDPRELLVDQRQLLAVEVQLAQQRRDGLALVGGQRLLGQPRAALAPEQVGGRAALAGCAASPPAPGSSAACAAGRCARAARPAAGAPGCPRRPPGTRPRVTTSDDCSRRLQSSTTADGRSPTSPVDRPPASKSLLHDHARTVGDRQEMARSQGFWHV